MACLELTCKNCGHSWFTNSSAEVCPECGCADTHKSFDEDTEYPDDHDTNNEE